MPESIVTYLDSLGMGSALIERVEATRVVIQRVVDQEVTGIFVSEYRTEEGQREYDSLWLVTDGFISEAIDFTFTDRSDVVPRANSIQRIEMIRRDYELDDEVSESSRLTLHVLFSGAGATGITGELKASGENCLALTAFLKEHLLPHMGFAG
jgi:hypothetical protein